jgi:hypothetical protein
MIDPNALSQLVQQEIQSSVQREVDSVVKQTNWISELENQIVAHVQDRITARFSNIATVPDLVQTVERSVKTLFENGFVPDIQDFVKEKTIRKSIDIAVENFVTQTLNNLTVDPKWVNKIENLVNQTMVDKLKQSINGVDVNQTLTEIVVDNRQTILAEFADNFVTNGIADTADELQLTVMNDAVVVEQELYTNNLTVEHNSHLKGDLLIDGDLAVKGRVNVDNASWQELAGYIGDKTYARVKNDFEHSVVDSVFDRAKQGIEFENVIVDGEHLLIDGTLSASIKKSGLTQVGKLQNLSVQGRIGINTDTPTDALSVWDEEVSIGAGKHSANTGYLGTVKNQDLVIGTNRQRQLVINKDGGVWVDKLTVGKNNIGHERSVPNYAGTKGDIVFNIDHKLGEPFAWICLGNYRWQELRSA